MLFLLSVFISTVCLLAGYSFGYDADRQYRDNKKLKRITISDKYRWLFRFQWAVGPEVNYISFLGELWAIFVSALLLLIGLVSMLVPLDAYAIVFFWFFLAFGFGLLVLAIILGIQILLTRPRCKRCWQCEIQRLICSQPYFCTVMVKAAPNEENGETCYLVVFGKFFPSTFKATTEDRFTPQIGSYAKAIYTSAPPFFHLVSHAKGIE